MHLVLQRESWLRTLTSLTCKTHNDWEHWLVQLARHEDFLSADNGGKMRPTDNVVVFALKSPWAASVSFCIPSIHTFRTHAFHAHTSRVDTIPSFYTHWVGPEDGHRSPYIQEESWHFAVPPARLPWFVLPQRPCLPAAYKCCSERISSRARWQYDFKTSADKTKLFMSTRWRRAQQ